MRNIIDEKLKNIRIRISNAWILHVIEMPPVEDKAPSPTANAIVADDLATQGTKTSAAILYPSDSGLWTPGAPFTNMV